MPKPIQIPKSAFAFCRYTVAILLWIAFLTTTKHITVFTFLIFFFSAILKIKNAPLIWLYTNTINKLSPSKEELLDEKAMQFIHTLATIFNAIILLFLYSPMEKIGYSLLFIFCILKTLSSFGFCPAGKLHSCLISQSSSCCSFLKKNKK